MNNPIESPLVVDLATWSVVKLTGPSVATFLQGQLTCDINQITEQRSSLAALCNHQGKVFAVMLLFKKESDFFAFVPTRIRDQFITHLRKFAVFSKTVLVDVTASFFVFGLIGKEISAFSNLPAEPNDVVNENGILLCQLPGATTTYLAWGPIELKQEFSKDNHVEENDLYWRTNCIFAGLPFLDDRVIGLVTPHMLNLPNLNAVSFKKGCYVGQEIIARTQYLGKAKRSLYLLTLEGEIESQSGDPVLAGDQEVGTIIMGVTFNGASYALAVLTDVALEQALSYSGHPVCEAIKTTDMETLRCFRHSCESRNPSILGTEQQ